MKKLSLLLILLNTGLAIFHTGWHDAGLFTVKLSNYGMFGYENCGIWPRGTNEVYIFGAGIWVGGLKQTPAGAELTSPAGVLDSSLAVSSIAGFDTLQGIIRLGDEFVYYRATTPTSFDSCVRGFAGTTAESHAAGDSVRGMAANVSVGYNPSSARSEFAPGDLPNEPGYTDTLDRILFSDNPADTALWPLRTPGGDRIVVSNEDSYNIANDLDSSRHDAGGTPLDFKVIEVGYAWYYHYYEDFIFLTNLIVNTSTTDTLKHLFLGLCCDADIGDATDDLVGSDQTRDLGYAWDSDFIEPGWPRTPGYVGYDFLESPVGQSGQLGLTAFKILHNPGIPGPGVPDPDNDLQAYLTVAGYDHPTGLYHPLDSIIDPTDVRFVQCTGPFNLAPLDTARVVIAVIYGADSIDLTENSDLAQRLYDSGFMTHMARVLTPNGGEEISGPYTITWEDSSATGAPLLADIGCSRDRGKTWRDIVVGIPSTGTYVWNTPDYPDGTRYLVRVTVHDTLAVGEDLSDTCFTVNNPGNGAPDVELLAPLRGTLRGTVAIEWDAADPDHDTLTIDLYFSPDTVDWEVIATGLANTGTYEWNTFLAHNGVYYLMVKASDRDTFTTNRSETTVEIANDHPQAAGVEHVRGGCNSLTILALEYDPTQYTGHGYEVSFEPIARGTPTTEPLYRYNLRDVTRDTMLLEQVELEMLADGNLFTQFSPLIDGFGLQFNTQVDKSGFRFVDYRVETNRSGFDGNLVIQGEDSLGIAPPLAGYEWCFRGSEFYLRWKREAPPDSLTIEVYDSTNQVLLPYDRSRGDCWHFGSGGSAARYYNQAVHKALFLGGGYFWFNRTNEMTIPPDTGDVWVVGSAGHRVPCNDNRYRFTPVGIAEGKDVLRTGICRIVPSPASRNATVHYSLARKQRLTVSIHDIAGRKVRTLIDGVQLPGRYSLTWDRKDDVGREMSAGVYFASLRSGQTGSVKKVVLVR